MISTLRKVSQFWWVEIIYDEADRAIVSTHGVYWIKDQGNGRVTFPLIKIRWELDDLMPIFDDGLEGKAADVSVTWHMTHLINSILILITLAVEITEWNWKWMDVKKRLIGNQTKEDGAKKETCK